MQIGQRSTNAIVARRWMHGAVIGRMHGALLLSDLLLLMTVRRAGRRTKATVDILLDVTHPDRWMAHCHIAEHHESGMMLSFDVTV